MTVDYEPFSERCRLDPYPYYRALREEAPVHFAPDAEAFVVSRYDDVEFVLKHPEIFSSDAMGGMLVGKSFEAAAEDAGMRIVILMDPPRHGPFRNLVNRGFTPRRIAMLEPRLDGIVDDAMSKIRGAAGFDAVKDLAAVVPVTIIAEMLGVETGRIDDFRSWSNDVIRGCTGSGRGAELFDGSSFQTSIANLFGYLGEIVERRAAEPRDDLITTLIQGESGEAGLSREEIGGFALVLLIAGNETTANLIGSMVKLLLDRPAELERVCEDRSLIPSLIEESLRLESPVQFLWRRAKRAVEVAGTRIPENAAVVPLLASANRDERRFARPDALDLSRGLQQHLAFGFGVHFCLGAALARLEARVVMEALLDELPHFALRPGGADRVDSFMMRGFRRLELERIS